MTLKSPVSHNILGPPVFLAGGVAALSVACQFPIMIGKSNAARHLNRETGERGNEPGAQIIMVLKRAQGAGETDNNIHTQSRRIESKDTKPTRNSTRFVPFLSRKRSFNCHLSELGESLRVYGTGKRPKASWC
jgi:hypothetical protein